MATKLNIEVVYATAKEQICVQVVLPEHSTIAAAIAQAHISTIPEVLNVGIFGRLRSIDYPLSNGDRVEIYSPLFIDPKDARMQRVNEERRVSRRTKQQQNEAVKQLLL